MATNVSISELTEVHWEDIKRIYRQGIETGIATFETEIPEWDEWHKKYHANCRFVAKSTDTIVGFAVLSKVSNREVYKGVAEVSIYIDADYRRQGVGKTLLSHLVQSSEAEGIWTLQAGIFTENKASIALHEQCGFRIVGVRERIGKLNNQWFDNCLMERRSQKLN